jgi:hypothetical protein
LCQRCKRFPVTESIYKRYAIVDDSMHIEAAQKLTAYAIEERARQSAQAAGAPLPAAAGQLSVREL